MSTYQPITDVTRAAGSTVGSLFHSIASSFPDRLALVDDNKRYTYKMLEERSNQLASLIQTKGLKQCDRIVVITQNSAEYIELILAAAKSGTILAAINWRLGEKELEHCISLVEPKLVVIAADKTHLLENIAPLKVPRLVIGEDYETQLSGASAAYSETPVDSEDGLIILYTSGTTGLPKGALISHRAMIARAMAYHTVMHVPDADNFIAWTPMYHMVSTDHGLATLLRGGAVWCVDGYKPDILIDLLEKLTMTWFVMVPGMVGDFLTEFKQRNCKPKGVRVIGAMADLIPAEEIAEATTLFNTPFLNTFGATETGLAPATGALIPIGETPTRLPKTQTPFCDLRLVDANDNEVTQGEPGEASVAGPTLFSGYWNNNETNRKDFRSGRFHMGDVLRRNPDGTLEYVDRLKYMIKSGGENIYPAEIEQVIMDDPRVEAAIVVRKPDAKWGEVPVVVIVKRDDRLNAEDVQAICLLSLAHYKRPKEVHFMVKEDIPRSTTGKIQRHLLEALLH